MSANKMAPYLNILHFNDNILCYEYQKSGLNYFRSDVPAIKNENWQAIGEISGIKFDFCEVVKDGKVVV